MTSETRPAPGIRVQIVYAQPEGYWSLHLSVADGASVAGALAEAGPALEEAGIRVDVACLAVFGRSVDPRTRLRDGDRIELLRPLLVNPRDARTSRAAANRKR